MKTNYLLAALVLFAAFLLAGCGSDLKVGELQNESQTVELGDAKSARVEVRFGAGDLKVSGGAEKLLEADFTYNVAKLKPEVNYSDGALVVKQPDSNGAPSFQNISDFRNEWDLNFSNDVPMDLSVDIGAGSSNLQFTGLSLTGLNIKLGAGESAIDLSGDWAQDLNVSIDAGAAAITVILPKDVGVRVEVDRGPTVINASDLTQDGDVYTNAAYGASSATLHVTIKTGIGQLNLEVK